MKKLLLFFIPLISYGQCDIEILGFDPISTDLLITVNGGQCGTEADSIGEFILALGFNPPLEITPWPCFGDDEFMLLLYPLDFPGFDIGEGSDNILQAGDTVLFNILDDTSLAGSGTLQCWNEALEEGSFFEECVILTVSQINDSDDIFGEPGIGGFPYPDDDIANNWLEFSLDGGCDPPPPPVPVDPEPVDGDTTTTVDPVRPTRPVRPVGDPCEDPCIHVPNVFTPDGDNINDYWRPITLSSCWLEWECKVYNRWGQVVWWSEDPSDKWFGEGGLSYVSDGVYTWTIKGKTFRSTKVVSIQGFVTLIR
jgi:gliding motility-associated-like protein